jgi:hypothetical protein
MGQTIKGDALKEEALNYVLMMSIKNSSLVTIRVSKIKEKKLFLKVISIAAGQALF